MGHFIYTALCGAISMASFYSWTRHGKRTERAIAPSFLRPMWRALIAAGAAAVVCGMWRTGFIGVLDYMVLYLGTMGQIVMVGKKIDGWMFWIITSATQIILFWLSASYLLFLRGIMYFTNNVAAYIRWRNEIAAAKENAKETAGL